MDCTYKTNGFGMALLNIIGITATDSTFNAGLAFICNETEPMLCLWELQSFDIVTKPSVSFVYCSSKKAFEDQMDYVSNQMAAKARSLWFKLNTKMELDKFTFGSLNILWILWCPLVKKVSKHALDKDVNDDQVACCHGAFGLSRSDVIAAAFSPTALATKRGRPAGSTKRKAIQREKSLFGARDWVEMFAMWSGWSQFLNMRLRKHLKQQ
ncbi:hypothetical protein BASA50_008439 [Batrachochytrium salamandrivorans]|uniref:MULE transposase domain-containing protein n=1 Tax=Batrachochytrium salamandrivorans TaxID=1357716 RepID=A0ABQ8F464_9FUNG|nr:hypothetical protein BASA50_008439 [Batrachochytrium salamandrivorans]